MAGLHRPGFRKNHGEREIRRRHASPEFSIDEVADTAKEKPHRNQRRHEVRGLQKADTVPVLEVQHRKQAADHAAVNAHAALPDCEDLERVLNEVRRLIKETVSDTAAQHDTQNAIEKQILKRVFPRQTAPLLLLANTAKKIEKRETD